MKKNAICSAIFFLALLSLPAQAAKIRVLIGVSQLANDLFFPDDVAASAFNKINTAMENSGLPTHDIELAPEVFVLPVTVENLSCDDMEVQLTSTRYLDCVHRYVGKLVVAPNTTPLREKHSADAVLVGTGSILGASGASGPGWHDPFDFSEAPSLKVPPEISLINDDEMYITIAPAGGFVGSTTNEVAEHEFGHVLYLEHQLPDQVHGLNSPAKGNHGFVAANGTKTIMFSSDEPQRVNMYSDKDGEFAPGIPKGDLDADAVDVIATKSWDVVAAYRPLGGQASTVQCTVRFTRCQGNNEEYAFSMDSWPSKIHIDSYQVQRSYNNSSWTTIFNGIAPCVPVLTIKKTWLRVRLLSALYGNSSWCNVVVDAGPCY